MKRALSVLPVVGLVIVLAAVLPAFSPPPLASSPSTDHGRFTGDDRGRIPRDGTGVWVGDDGQRDDEEDPEGWASGEFTPFGTAERVSFLGNDVLRLDTLPAGAFGGATVGLGIPMGSLARRVSVNVFLVDIDCFGGSPRISLRVDLDGDGTSDGNAWGYPGPFPSFAGCARQVWRHHDLTDGVARWDTSQLSGAVPGTICGSFVCTFGEVAAFLGANFPRHSVLRGNLVQDAFTATMQGTAFYDDVRIGAAVLE